MNRFFRFTAALLAILTGFNSSAQEKKQYKTGDDDHSLLWRISGKATAKPSYLFGTIHIICAEDYLWTVKMKESLDKSDKVCFEMDIADPAVMMQVAAGLIDNSGKKLSEYFTPVQYKMLQKYIKDSIGMDISLFSQMKPVFLQTLIEAKKSIGCANPVSYEDSISKTAAKGNKEILGLETPEEQLMVLETLPADSVINAINEQVQGGNEKGRAAYAQMLTAYKRQDLPQLYKLIAYEEAGEDMGALLDERNKKWIPRISDKMKSSSVFFAVGAGHLYGANGVISLLRKDGYNVEPVK